MGISYKTLYFSEDAGQVTLEFPWYGNDLGGTVFFTTVDRSAKLNSDYFSLPYQVYVPRNSVGNYKLTLTFVNDFVKEGQETFIVRSFNEGVGAQYDEYQYTIVINDEDTGVVNPDGSVTGPAKAKDLTKIKSLALSAIDNITNSIDYIGDSKYIIDSAIPTWDIKNVKYKTLINSTKISTFDSLFDYKVPATAANSINTAINTYQAFQSATDAYKNGSLTDAIRVGCANFIVAVASGEIGSVAGAGVIAGMAAVGAPALVGIAVGAFAGGIVSGVVQAVATDYLKSTHVLPQSDGLAVQSVAGQFDGTSLINPNLSYGAPQVEPSWEFDPITYEFRWLKAPDQAKIAELSARFGLDQTTPISLEIAGDKDTDVNDLIYGGAGADRLFGLSGDDILFGQGADDEIDGGAGRDVIDGGAGDDLLLGGQDGDQLNGDTGSDTLHGGAGNDQLWGKDGNDLLWGGDGDDQIYGGSGNDVVIGDAGADVIDGGTGYDTLSYEQSRSGVQAILGNSTISLGSNSDNDAAGDVAISIERLVGSSFNDSLSDYSTGNSAGNALIGGAGDDFIDGGEGDDWLEGGEGSDSIKDWFGNDWIFGGAGNDTIYIGKGNRVIDGGDDVDTLDYSQGGVFSDEPKATGFSIDLSTGIATVLFNGEKYTQSLMNVENIFGLYSYSNELRGAASDNYILGGNMSDLIYGMSGNDFLSGRSGSDTIQGGSGNDFIDGGIGDDLLYGGDGDDMFWDAAGSDDIIAGAGDDKVVYDKNDSFVDGGEGTDILIIYPEPPIYYVPPGGIFLGELIPSKQLTVNLSWSNQVAEVAGIVRGFEGLDYSNFDTSVSLIGTAETNILIGSRAGDKLNGGAGADILQGLAGDDIYYVDNALDQVIESAAGGFDGVGVSVSYALAAGQEIERLGTTSSAGTAAINLTGNEFAQTLVGNAGNNALNGRGGADTMYGYAGNDIYYVDNAADQVIEAINGGTDAVGASVSYVLAKGQSIETLSTTSSAGTAAINLTGNELAQTIRGNAGANALKGGGGGDSLYGLGGDDTYYVYASSDKVFEAANQGNDTVAANVHFALASGQSIETMATFASAGTTSINLTGNEVGQSIRGNAGANVLNGKGGTDVLTGLGGADTFVFDTALGSGNVDRITDFVTSISKVHDTIQLAKGIFTALAPGDLSAAAFKETSAGTVDANDRILYDKTTGALSYDSDGLGGTAAVQFVTLDNKVALSHLDFFVV